MTAMRQQIESADLQTHLMIPESGIQRIDSGDIRRNQREKRRENQYIPSGRMMAQGLTCGIKYA